MKKKSLMVMSFKEKILGVVNPVVCKVIGHHWVHKMRDWLCHRCRVSQPYEDDGEWGYYGSPPRYWKARDY